MESCWVGTCANDGVSLLLCDRDERNKVVSAACDGLLTFREVDIFLQVATKKGNPTHRRVVPETIPMYFTARMYSTLFCTAHSHNAHTPFYLRTTFVKF